MRDVLKVIRWQNLLIVAGTMVLMRYVLLASLLGEMQVYSLSGDIISASLQFPWYNFVILVLVTVCLTAGGYVINDYFDIKTDLVNRGSVVVGTSIPRRKALKMHNVFNILAVAGGFYVSWSAGYFWFGTIFLLVSGLLWFYSASYKRQFLIGNLLVAFLTALLPLLVTLFEFPAMHEYYAHNAATHPDYGVMFFWAGGFALFAFLTTLTREIVKDIEDYEGDREYGRNSMPVVLGIRASKAVVVSLLLLTIAALYTLWALYVSDRVTLIYMSLTLVLPMIAAIAIVLPGSLRNQFHNAATIMKMVMLAGILYMVVVKIILSAGLYQDVN